MRKWRVRMAKLICKDCGSTKGNKRSMRGSILIEIILWVCFIVPGLIYSIWRHTTVTRACKSCGSSSLVPVNSPIGKKLLEEMSQEAS